MTLYTVKWEIEIEADNPVAAAQEALAIQRDPESIATFFEVTEETNSCDGTVYHSVDLNFDDGCCLVKNLSDGEVTFVEL